MSPGQPWRYAPPPHPRIRAIPAFDDNYIWLLLDAGRTRALVVDPGDAGPVLQTLRAIGATLEVVLVTHHHRDHVGGLAELRREFPGARCYGPANPAIDGIDARLGDGDTVSLDAFDVRFRVTGVPGHTLDHIAFHADRIGSEDSRPVLFCGDTLFAAGCGKVFEGSPEQMLASLDRLAALDSTALVHCAHEYTLSNLAFARAVEPGNAALAERAQEAAAMRARGIPTVPSDLASELATNPFLRCRFPAVRAAAAGRLGHPPVSDTETFATLRRWKNEFRRSEAAP